MSYVTSFAWSAPDVPVDPAGDAMVTFTLSMSRRSPALSHTVAVSLLLWLALERGLVPLERDPGTGFAPLAPAAFEACVVVRFEV